MKAVDFFQKALKYLQALKALKYLKALKAFKKLRQTLQSFLKAQSFESHKNCLGECFFKINRKLSHFLAQL